MSRSAFFFFLIEGNGKIKSSGISPNANFIEKNQESKIFLQKKKNLQKNMNLADD